MMTGVRVDIALGALATLRPSRKASLSVTEVSRDVQRRVAAALAKSRLALQVVVRIERRVSGSQVDGPCESLYAPRQTL